jgi:hypothetical protein
MMNMFVELVTILRITGCMSETLQGFLSSSWHQNMISEGTCFIAPKYEYLNRFHKLVIHLH